MKILSNTKQHERKVIKTELLQKQAAVVEPFASTVKNNLTNEAKKCSTESRTKKSKDREKFLEKSIEN